MALYLVKYTADWDGIPVEGFEVFEADSAEGAIQVVLDQCFPVTDAEEGAEEIDEFHYPEVDLMPFLVKVSDDATLEYYTRDFLADKLVADEISLDELAALEGMLPLPYGTFPNRQRAK